MLLLSASEPRPIVNKIAMTVYMPPGSFPTCTPSYPRLGLPRKWHLNFPLKVEIKIYHWHLKLTCLSLIVGQLSSHIHHDTNAHKQYTCTQLLASLVHNICPTPRIALSCHIP